MKHNGFYLYLNSTEFIEDKQKRLSGIFDRLYKSIRMYRKRQKLKALLSELVERRKKIDDLIQTVKYLESILDNENTPDHYQDPFCKGEDIYAVIVDRLFRYTSDDISFIIYDLACTLKEVDEKIYADDIYLLINYKISAGIKNYFVCPEKQQEHNLKDLNYDVYFHFCEEKSIFSRIYFEFVWEQYKKLYSLALDTEKTDLELLLQSSLTDTQTSIAPIQSQLLSQLFRSTLSKYIFTWRAKNHITQKELAQKSGVDRTMIAKIEKLQQNASLDTTLKLLSAMNAYLIIVPQE